MLDPSDGSISHDIVVLAEKVVQENIQNLLTHCFQVLLIVLQLIGQGIGHDLGDQFKAKLINQVFIVQFHVGAYRVTDVPYVCQPLL